MSILRHGQRLHGLNHDSLGSAALSSLALPRRRGGGDGAEDLCKVGYFLPLRLGTSLVSTGARGSKVLR